MLNAQGCLVDLKHVHPKELAHEQQIENLVIRVKQRVIEIDEPVPLYV